jgi:hypothetical protein
MTRRDPRPQGGFAHEFELPSILAMPDGSRAMDKLGSYQGAPLQQKHANMPSQ